MKRFFALLLALAVLLSLPLTASANAAEPPTLTIAVVHAPEDLTLTLHPADTSAVIPGREGVDQLAILLRRSERNGVALFRFYDGDLITPLHSSAWFGSDKELAGAVILAESGGRTVTIELDQVNLRNGYGAYATLDWKTGAVNEGLPRWRNLIYVALRVGLTLLIEGLIFFACGYRTRRSWLIFLFINLVTQSLLNLALSGLFALEMVNPYWQIVYGMGEAVVFAAEMLVFGLFVKEHGRGTAVLTAFIANLLSLILGGFLLMLLPI